MAIPDFQSIMRPLLEAHEDGKEHINRELVASLADRFDLTQDERRKLLPSGSLGGSPMERPGLGDAEFGGV